MPVPRYQIRINVVIEDGTEKGVGWNQGQLIHKVIDSLFLPGIYIYRQSSTKLVGKNTL